MPDIEIKRGYEVLPDNNIRFGISITNASEFAISDVEVILDYSESLFKLESESRQKIGNLPPAGTHTAEFILKPLGCVHNVNIDALISYRDPKWDKHVETMRPKEVHCVCPFLKGKKMQKAEFLELSGSGHSAETGLNFTGVDVERLTSFLVQTCKNRHYKVDELSIDGGKMLCLASESIGEKAYYLLTALIREDAGLTQVMLKAVSDKPYGLNGFLNETMADLRHVVETVQSAREIGVIKKEQVINIIDSVVQKSTFGGEGVADVHIEGSVVHGTEFKGDDEQKRLEEERLERERVEEEKGKKQKDEQEQRRRKEDEKLRRQREDEKARQKNESLQREKAEREERQRREAAEREQKTKKEREIIADEAALKRGHDAATKASRSPAGQREIKITGAGKPSPTKFYALVLVLGALLVGFWLLAPGSDTTTNSIGMEFVLVPAGEFEMGSPSSEKDRDYGEGPVHTVKIEKAYYLGKYEVTQKQWREVMGSNPSYFKGDDLPVEKVSWNDAQEFVKKLNEKEGTDKYRLPSEAEWEYAARAGTNTLYSFGNDESDLGDYAWYGSNLGSKTHSVGHKQPNPWGLYDMHGNVWEWVQDRWHNDYDGAPTDGSSWEEGSSSSRVFRGGSWGSYAWFCWSASRSSSVPGLRNSYLGFRLLQES